MNSSQAFKAPMVGPIQPCVDREAHAMGILVMFCPVVRKRLLSHD